MAESRRWVSHMKISILLKKEEGVILFCQCILEARRISCLHVSALFTIPLNQCLETVEKLVVKQKNQTESFFQQKCFWSEPKTSASFSGLLLVEKHEGNKRWNIKNMIKNFKFFNCFSRFARALKVHYCRFADLPISSSSHKNNMPKISHYSTLYTLTYAHKTCDKFVYKHSETTEYVKN